MNIHWHFKFIAYNETKDGNQIIMPVETTIVNQITEADALDEVRQIIIRKNYFLKDAWQCNTCEIQEKQLEIFNKIGEALKIFIEEEKRKKKKK